MLLARKLKLHIGPILVAIGLILLTAVWHALDSMSNGRLVSGSSLPGLVTGSIAAAIILFELLLWPRKKLRRWKLFPTRFWLSAHIWLGLATGPLAFIHSGYRFGGKFSTTLMCLLLFVIASGVYGWVLQMVIPKWMLGNLPQETILSQIDDVLIQSALDARRILTVAFGEKPKSSESRIGKLVNLDKASAAMLGSSTIQDADGEKIGIVVGAFQRRGDMRTHITEQNSAEFNQADANEIWRQYVAVIEPHLLAGIRHPLVDIQTLSASAKSPIRTPQKMIDWFVFLRDSCSESSTSIVGQLQRLCEQRHQFDAQRRAHAWLHGWIAVHAGVSVLLGILLVTHIILALKFM